MKVFCSNEKLGVRPYAHYIGKLCSNFFRGKGGEGRMKHIVEVEWLQANLNDENICIIDTRFQLGDPKAGLNDYVKGHIPGAIYFDLEKDLSGKVQQHGGRHPLPMLEEFVDKLSAAGIDHNAKVVIYDDQHGAMASRLWWMLKFLGHELVFVLNGGFSKWCQSSLPTNSEVPIVNKKVFVPNIQDNMHISMEEVKERIQQQVSLFLDSREEKRYLGIEEPIDRVAGHIPTAKHAFWKDSLSSDGTWKSKLEQEARFSTLQKETEIIVYCGSGVTACPNILALYEADFSNVKLYVGSWSDWISYPENEIELN